MRNKKRITWIGAVVIILAFSLFVVATELYVKTDTSAIGVISNPKKTSSPSSSNDLIAEQARHYSYYPQLDITNGTNKIIWTWGDANYTSDPIALIGNTDFGLDIEEALKTPVSVVKPESRIEFKVDEVAGLDKPTYKVRLVDSNKQLKLYPMNNNSIVLPKAEGEYLFQLQVRWGNENHEIYYWFHVETQKSIQPPIATNITMEDKKQVEQVIRDYLNNIDKQNYEEAWKLLAPQDRDGQTQESFMVVHQGVKSIKLISIEGYSLVADKNNSAIVYDEKVPTVTFHLVLDVVPLEGSAWGEGRNERFVVGRKGIDGEWLVSGFATSP
ncbi:hypothetical protein UF75_5466 [Desulfosporosinus sp. I2]|uniref:hypothetical protein n=1 Tax=Desulfosporosinus sp. I2 TaxID=1617025 RepID=UPI0005EE12F7|nr:hypothetical protein [Desulfosporosinus sp. I2]KJR44152.1 hypothetical protein UF75_5466 [Desulfosporosinus sp. I2]